MELHASNSTSRRVREEDKLEIKATMCNTVKRKEGTNEGTETDGRPSISETLRDRKRLPELQ